jgi:hypothetical protein
MDTSLKKDLVTDSNTKFAKKVFSIRIHYNVHVGIKNDHKSPNSTVAATRKMPEKGMR